MTVPGCVSGWEDVLIFQLFGSGSNNAVLFYTTGGTSLGSIVVPGSVDIIHGFALCVDPDDDTHARLYACAFATASTPSTDYKLHCWDIVSLPDGTFTITYDRVVYSDIWGAVIPNDNGGFVVAGESAADATAYSSVDHGAGSLYVTNAGTATPTIIATDVSLAIDISGTGFAAPWLTYAIDDVVYLNAAGPSRDFDPCGPPGLAPNYAALYSKSSTILADHFDMIWMAVDPMSCVIDPDWQYAVNTSQIMSDGKVYSGVGVDGPAADLYQYDPTNGIGSLLGLGFPAGFFGPAAICQSFVDTTKLYVCAGSDGSVTRHPIPPIDSGVVQVLTTAPIERVRCWRHRCADLPIPHEDNKGAIERGNAPNTITWRDENL